MQKLKIKATKNEFLMFILLLKNYYESLWRNNNHGQYLPEKSYNLFSSVCLSYMKLELNLFYHPILWENFRYLFKDSTEKETIRLARHFYNSWGEFQNK